MTARVLLTARGPVTEEALATLDAAVALAPNAFEPRFLRGALRFAAGRDADALEDAGTAVTLGPADARARVLRWRILQRLGRLPEAEVDLDATAKSPFLETEPDLWMSAVEVYFARGRIDDGIRWLRRVLEGRPFWPEGWELLAAAYDRTGHADDAALARRNVPRARRNSVVLLQRDARLAAWRQDWRLAGELLRQAAAQDPTYGPVQSDLERVRVAERGGR
jgi:predicted Zn-dependent protease